jgi:hypothetical protein
VKGAVCFKLASIASNNISTAVCFPSHHKVDCCFCRSAPRALSPFPARRRLPSRESLLVTAPVERVECSDLAGPRMIWQGQIRQLGQSQGMVQCLQLATIRCAADARNIFLFPIGQISYSTIMFSLPSVFQRFPTGLSDEPNRTATFLVGEILALACSAYFC